MFGETVGVGGGLVARQSLPTIRKWTSPFNFQLNEPFLKFLWKQKAISKFLLHISGKYEVWRGVIHPPITLNLKSGTKNSDYQSNEPRLKSLWPPFLQKPYMPPGHNLQPLSWGLWRGFHPQMYTFRTFQLRLTKWPSQSFDWVCLGKW